jgi:hypothetical protein
MADQSNRVVTTFRGREVVADMFEPMFNGDHRWQIAYPDGVRQFYGTASEVRAEMDRYLGSLADRMPLAA